MARILVVEDHKILRETIVTLIRDLGHEVSEAPDGRDAFRIVREQPFDLIVTDFRMKKWTGLQLLSALRIRQIKTPVILCTGLTDERILASFRKEGFVTVLIKDQHLHETLPAAIRKGLAT